VKHNLISFCHAHLVHANQLDPDYDALCRRARDHYLTAIQREMLKQLVECGPVWDGDVLSKEARDDLLASGLASRACVRGDQGYTVANYCGWDVLRVDG
jgi:hypothetical protein